MLFIWHCTISVRHTNQWTTTDMLLGRFTIIPSAFALLYLLIPPYSTCSCATYITHVPECLCADDWGVHIGAQQGGRRPVTMVTNGNGHLTKPCPLYAPYNAHFNSPPWGLPGSLGCMALCMCVDSIRRYEGLHNVWVGHVVMLGAERGNGGWKGVDKNGNCCATMMTTGHGQPLISEDYSLTSS